MKKISIIIETDSRLHGRQFDFAVGDRATIKALEGYLEIKHYRDKETDYSINILEEEGEDHGMLPT